METEKKERTFQSEDIKELVTALSKAQGIMEPAKFNKINPHFKNKYADFKSCMDACRGPLSENGLSVMQYCEMIGDKLTLVTMLAHSSGQWIKSDFPLIPKNFDSQGIGSAMTYGKRYSLSCMLGIVSDDDDDDAETANGRGNSASKKSPEPQVQQKPIVKKINEEQIKNLNFYLDECDDVFRTDFENKLKKHITGYKDYSDISVTTYEAGIKAIELHLYGQKEQKTQAMNQ